MASSLKSKAVSGLLWSGLDAVSQQVLVLGIGIILARLLDPADFGLIGMLAIFMAIARAFLNSGFGQALIQKKDATEIDACSVFYFSVVVGLIAAGLLGLAAPWIASFYRQPQLTALTRVMAINIVINSFALVPTTLLSRQIDFKTQTKISLIATASSGVAGVTLAFLGFGVWSLAIQQITVNVLRTVLVWCFSTWRPSLLFSLMALRAMFVYGSRLLASGLLNTIFDNLYFVVIGRLFSAGQLGIYSRARTMEQMPTTTFSEMVTRVIFPVFSAVQDDPIRLKRGLRKVLTVVVFIHFPIMIGLAAVARPLVLVLLTEKWLPCVPYLQLLCLAGLFFPLHVVNLDILKAKGRSDLFFRLEVAKKILVVIAIAATYRWGVIGLIYGQIGVSMLAYYLNTHYTGRLIGYPIHEQVRDALPYLGTAALMGVAVYGLQYLPLPTAWVGLFCQIVVGLVLYPALCAAVNLSALGEVVGVVRPRLAQVKGRYHPAAMEDS
ncbi:MAG TPA: lipopolysaccharide biosynthesis protein [Sedimentisphaerales bacterium]|nr:lipopolysaccharide biosynthesis protein [Sedimentisphaerales bacterium]HRV46948.1 lipopolysaccharide biosynthesis protein [Sedimentisphaerales bacterium]